MSDIGGGNLIQCTIGGTDIRNLVSYVEYFENILSPAASCAITINDASGFYQQLKKDGGEDVMISFGERVGDSIRMKFKTAKISDRVRVKENQDTYKINCVPSEFIDNNAKEIVKSYQGKKIDEIVKEVHDEYIKSATSLKTSLVTTESTEGQSAYTGTGRSPIAVLRWACKEGKSAEAKASNYVYYQDRDGYHFKTIDKMLQSSSIATLSYATQNIGKAGGDPATKIIAFDQQTDTNQLDSTFNGSNSDHWYFYDPTTGVIGGGSKRDGAGDTTHTGRNPVTGEEQSARGQRFNFVVAPGFSESKFRDSRDPTIKQRRRTLPEHGAKSSAANQLDNLVMNVRVPGFVKYKPGVKVNLRIPANQESNQIDKRSGDYLITAVRHITYRDDKDMKYECILQCKSDSKKASSGNSGVG
jgi:hypothetical protein